MIMRKVLLSIAAMMIAVCAVAQELDTDALTTATVQETVAQEKLMFVVEGPENKYNQVRVYNETSQENFRCRLVLLNDDGSIRETYGEYNLKEKSDFDSNTNWIYQGAKVGIQMPKDFPTQVSFAVQYKDYPLFDAIFIRLYDKQDNGGFSDEF